MSIVDNQIINILTLAGWEKHITVKVLDLVVWNLGKMSVPNYSVQEISRDGKVKSRHAYTWDNEACKKVPEEYRSSMVSLCGNFLFDATPYGCDIFRRGMFSQVISNEPDEKRQAMPYSYWHEKAARMVGAEI